MKFLPVIKITTSAALIILVSTAMIISLFGMTSSVQVKGINLKCERIWHAPGERNIILRIDDIQAFTWRETQIKMVEDALERNKTLVLGVIPGISGGIFEDIEIIKLLQEKKCKVEIALHGYEHTYREFRNLSFSKAEKKINKGLIILNEIEKDIVTFIPPDNTISQGTFPALKKHGIKFISAGHNSDEYGFSSSTYDWDNKKLESIDTVIEECSDALDEKGLCIIMLHPQDYTDSKKNHNPEKYAEYIKLLEEIDKLNATSITFRDLILKGTIFIN